AVANQLAQRGELGRAGHPGRPMCFLPGSIVPAAWRRRAAEIPSAWRSACSSSSYSAAAGTANMSLPSLVSRSKFSVSDFSVTPWSRSSLMVVRTCAARATPPVGLPEHQRVAGLQGGQGLGEGGPLDPPLAGLFLGEHLVIAVGRQRIHLELGVLIAR